MPEEAAEKADPRFSQLVSVLADRYTFLSMVGRGGGATVYEVRNLRLDRIEALKVLSEAMEHDFADRFAHEAKVAASLDHPAIVQVYDFGQEGRMGWYSMQLIDGPTVASIMKANPRLGESAVVRVAVPILDALDYSHRRGVVHRDIKPANILIDGQGRPHLTDFGVAKSVDSVLKTRTGLIMGTPAYIAPEQAMGEQVDARVDIYALGVTLYQMLTGELPFRADNVLQTVVMRLKGDPDPLLSRRPDANSLLAEVVMGALARDKTQRFDSAANMRDALIAACDSSGIAWARPLTEFASTRVRRRPLPPMADPAPAAKETPRAVPRELSVTAPLETRDFEHERRPRKRWKGVAGALLAIGLAVVLVGWLTRHEQPRDQAVAAVNGLPTAAPTATGASDPVLAPTTTSTPVPALSPAPSPSPSPSPPPVAPPRAETRATVAPTASATGGRAEQPLSSPAVGPPAVYPELLETAAPDPAETAGCPGERVTLSLTIGEDGSVKSSKALSRAKPECIRAARHAVLKYKFKPALDAQGKPVSAPTALSVEFPEGP